MRHRILLAIVATSLAVVAVLGFPLAYVLGRLAHQEAEAQLQRQAEAVLLGIEVQANAIGAVRTATLAELVPAGDHLRLTTPGGDTYLLGQEIDGGTLAASATGPTTGFRLELTTSSSSVDERVQRARLVVAGLGVAAVAAAALLGAVLARRMAAPLDDLASVAARLGDGDFSVPAPRSGLAEVDAMAQALDRSSARIAELVRAERSFSSNASHQLRSALTGLRLRLEELAVHPDPDVRDEAAAALGQAERLSDVVRDLLALARTGRAGPGGRFDAAALVTQHVADWQGPLARQGREVRVVAAEPAEVEATAGAVGQALDVLLANVVGHGAGTITVTVRRGPSQVEVDVCDEGPGIAPGQEHAVFERRPDREGHGIGLALARELVAAETGRLELVHARPPTFRLTLPGAVVEPWPPPTPVPA